MSHLHLLLLLRWSSYYPPPLPNTNNQSWCTVSSIITRNCLSSALLKTESLIRSKCSLTNYKVLDLQVCLDPARIQNQRRPRTVSDDGWGPSLSASGLNLIEFSFIWKLLKYEKKKPKDNRVENKSTLVLKGESYFSFWLSQNFICGESQQQPTDHWRTTQGPPRGPPSTCFFFICQWEKNCPAGSVWTWVGGFHEDSQRRKRRRGEKQVTGKILTTEACRVKGEVKDSLNSIKINWKNKTKSKYAKDLEQTYIEN